MASLGAQALKPLIGRIGIGLHLNLTVGAPIGPMPIVAPAGHFPALRELLVQFPYGSAAVE